MTIEEIEAILAKHFENFKHPLVTRLRFKAVKDNADAPYKLGVIANLIDYETPLACYMTCSEGLVNMLGGVKIIAEELEIELLAACDNPSAIPVYQYAVVGDDDV